VGGLVFDFRGHSDRVERPRCSAQVYEFDDAQEPIPQKDAIAPLQGRYLGDQDAIRARIEGVKAQTK